MKWQFTLLTSDVRLNFFSGSNPLSLHSTTGCKDCSSPMQMKRNVAGGWLYVERVCTVSSKLWMLHLYMQAANKKCYLRIYISQFVEIFSLKFMKMIKSITCVLFQGLCFYSYGLYLSDETLWDGIKSWDSSLHLHWPRQSSWWGCYRTAVDPHTRYA